MSVLPGLRIESSGLEYEPAGAERAELSKVNPQLKGLSKSRDPKLMSSMNGLQVK